MVLAEIGTSWSDINDIIINEDGWNGVLDDGISNGYTNWQLFCSRKPHHQAYQLTQYYIWSFDEESGEFETDGTTNVKSFNPKNDLHKISARYDKHPKFEISEQIKPDYERRKGRGPIKGGSAPRTKLRISSEFSPDKFTSIEQLDAWCDKLFSELTIGEYQIKEAHDYCMILDEKYYNPYHEWLKVGMALRETSNLSTPPSPTKLFATWLLFSAKSPKFKFENVLDMWKLWNDFGEHDSENPVSFGSIRYWARQCDEKKFWKYVIELLTIILMKHLKSPMNMILLLSCMHCIRTSMYVSIKNNIWYEFNNHRWAEIDSGVNLRQKDVKRITSALCFESA